MLEHLKEQLIEHGFVLNQRSSQEVFEKIVNTEENKYILKLVKLICTFIQNFKTNGYTIDKFYEWESQTTNERTRLFLDVCQLGGYSVSWKRKLKPTLMLLVG